MRVIAGKFKGHILRISPSAKIRPTSEKVKQALFNILGRKIYKACFLELYAGSGSVGIEALSRGAKRTVFVENHRLCIKAIEDNLKKMGVKFRSGIQRQQHIKAAAALILAVPAQKAVQILQKQGNKFDLVFLDPPYYREELKNSLIKIALCDIVNPQSLIIAEHAKKQTLPQTLPGLELIFTRNYGDAALSFYKVRIKK